MASSSGVVPTMGEDRGNLAAVGLIIHGLVDLLSVCVCRCVCVCVGVCVCV